MLLKSPSRFDETLATHALPPLRRGATTTLQVNMGRRCNQTCRHCHVDAGPTRNEMMDERVASRVLDVLSRSRTVATVDITGGAPELNPHFRTLVEGATSLGRQVMVRCNLTVLRLPDQRDTADFFAARRVVVTASLPCYTSDNVDRQRGSGVFETSIESLRVLNALGYGAAEGDDRIEGLRLHLAYNPLGPSLPPPQVTLEAEYRRRLKHDFGIRFDRLFTFANMPIHRFADDLERQGRLQEYEDLLASMFNPEAADKVMCRSLLSVDWEGRLADCDFNQMLRMPLGGRQRTIFDVDQLDHLEGETVATASHCLACTAGQGSSCGGALAEG